MGQRHPAGRKPGVRAGMVSSMANRKPSRSPIYNDPLLNKTDLDPFLDETREDNGYQKLLSNLQGNILKGHDRDNAVMIFLNFGTVDARTGKLDDQDLLSRVKIAIGKNAKYVTSAKLQLNEWKRFQQHRIPGGTFVNFFLTAAGYEALGYSRHLAKFDGRFVASMQKAELNDPDISTWERGYRQTDRRANDRIHAMLLLADDDPLFLGRELRRVFRDLMRDEDDKELARILFIERGETLRDSEQQPIEHFGYRDGISNPMFLHTDKETIDKYGGDSAWNPRAPLGLVLVPDPLMRKNSYSYGSYLVFRKLEQHVERFENAVKDAARAKGLNPESEEDRKKVMALLLGRFPNGTPIALESREKPQSKYSGNLNNFNYAHPKNGCPMHAHIRKSNLRQGEKDRRIVRRGMTWGARDLRNEPHPPSGDVGLLFMCFQADIARQYEFLQRRLNDPHRQTDSGHDPIAGQLDPDKSLPPKPRPIPDLFGSCVSFKGGEYFFAPSIPFLKNIGSIREDVPS